MIWSERLNLDVYLLFLYLAISRRFALFCVFVNFCEKKNYKTKCDQFTLIQMCNNSWFVRLPLRHNTFTLFSYFEAIAFYTTRSKHEFHMILWIGRWTFISVRGGGPRKLVAFWRCFIEEGENLLINLAVWIRFNFWTETYAVSFQGLFNFSSNAPSNVL